MTDPVRKTLELQCDAAWAFEVFVNQISLWWPLDGHSVSAGSGESARAITIEAKVGGAVYETMFDGTRTDWGEVTAFLPGRRLAMTWHPGTNKNAPTCVEVDFEDLPDSKTRVTLTHSGWEVWGDKADEMRTGYSSGWDFVFGERFATGCGG